MTQEQHFDVASYALGVLDERDAERFEEHLLDCPTCAVDLESFIAVADLLADVDADALLAAEQSRQDGLVLKKVIGEVKKERRRANSRRLYSLAAAVVIFAMLSIGALFAGGKWFGPAQGPPTAIRTSSPTLDPLPPDGGVGGPELSGERFGATDARTGVRADVALQKKDWGTHVAFGVSNITGPRNCQLVVVRTDGSTAVVSTWTVGDKGWGTAANPQTLTLQADTGIPRDDIAHVQIQSIDSKGAAETLVRVP